MGELLLTKTKLEYRSTLSKEATKLGCGLFLLLSCSKKEPEQLHVRLCHKPRRMKPLLVVFFFPHTLGFLLLPAPLCSLVSEKGLVLQFHQDDLQVHELLRVGKREHSVPSGS